MHKINHQNCVQLYEMYETKNRVYMVLEILAGGELFDRISNSGSYSGLPREQFPFLVGSSVLKWCWKQLKR